MSLLDYRVPLSPANLLVTKDLWKRCTFLLEYATNILSLDYHFNQNKVHLSPPFVAGNEEMLIYPTARAVILSKSQSTITTSIQLEFLKGHLATIFSVSQTSPCEPLVFSGVLEPVYSDEFILLVGNHTDTPLFVDTKVPIVYVHMVHLKI